MTTGRSIRQCLHAPQMGASVTFFMMYSAMVACHPPDSGADSAATPSPSASDTSDSDLPTEDSVTNDSGTTGAPLSDVRSPQHRSRSRMDLAERDRADVIAAGAARGRVAETCAGPVCRTPTLRWWSATRNGAALKAGAGGRGLTPPPLRWDRWMKLAERGRSSVFAVIARYQNLGCGAHRHTVLHDPGVQPIGRPSRTAIPKAGAGAGGASSPRRIAADLRPVTWRWPAQSLSLGHHPGGTAHAAHAAPLGPTWTKLAAKAAWRHCHRATRTGSPPGAAQTQARGARRGCSRCQGSLPSRRGATISGPHSRFRTHAPAR